MPCYKQIINHSINNNNRPAWVTHTLSMIRMSLHLLLCVHERVFVFWGGGGKWANLALPLLLEINLV